MLTTNSMIRFFILAGFGFVFACGGGTSGSNDELDAGVDAGSDAGVDAGEDSGEVEEDAGIDAGVDAGPPPATDGEPCWTSILHQWHPNYGLPDCATGLKCIGDSDEAWCTKRCSATGTTNEEEGGLHGWCCGELTNPCAPQRFWLPATMNFFCIPLIAPLAEACDVDTEWTGDNRRCAPVCDGETIVHHTQCAQYDNGTFCTYTCDPANGDADCLIEPAFEGGCCGDLMNGSWCLIPELCSSSTD